LSITYSPNQLEWLQIILRERLSIHLSINLLNEKCAVITLPSSTKKIEITLDPLTFLKADASLLMRSWFPESEGWLASSLGSDLPAPGLLKGQSKLIYKTNEGYSIKYDILGLIFRMLTRLEEIDHDNIDCHGRYSAYASHAFKNGYLERPIVDEWLIILRQIMKRLWPSHDLVENNFKIKLSHDVDIVSRYRFATPYHIIRRVMIDILKYRDFRSALLAPWGLLSKSIKLSKYDRFNTFEWIMEQSEANSLTSSFYFICGRTNPQFDAEYEPEHPIIRRLLRTIHARGHEIGLHPSYNSYQDPDIICSEAERLRKICDEENITQDIWGGRMHFLRWKHPNTLYGWEKAKMNYDSTMGFAEHAGFRCGTCHEYPAFDPLLDRIVNLRIQPLIVMEHTVISKSYMGLGLSNKAHDKILQLKNACKEVNGSFTLLWHNNQLATKAERDLYTSIIK
tara:strand:+ start:19456 stop:20814 length:1359 start_codon:yes stop_codon:yes gene_type:complete